MSTRPSRPQAPTHRRSRNWVLDYVVPITLLMLLVWMLGFLMQHHRHKPTLPAPYHLTNP